MSTTPAKYISQVSTKKAKQLSRAVDSGDYIPAKQNMKTFFAKKFEKKLMVSVLNPDELRRTVNNSSILCKKSENLVTLHL